jgi:hypothetical protein
MKLFTEEKEIESQKSWQSILQNLALLIMRIKEEGGY